MDEMTTLRDQIEHIRKTITEVNNIIEGLTKVVDHLHEERSTLLKRLNTLYGEAIKNL